MGSPVAALPADLSAMSAQAEQFGALLLPLLRGMTAEQRTAFRSGVNQLLDRLEKEAGHV